MNEKFKISIVIPIYNLQDELLRCVDSIKKQTHKNIEIILVDDGSNDNTCEVIRRLVESDKRIISIYKKNGGVTSARMEGIKQATGDYIGFVDGDDEIEANMYEVLLANAIKYQADISHCGYQMVFADGRVHYFYNTGRFVEQDKLTGVKDLLSGVVVEPGLCNKLYRRELFDCLLDTGVMDMSIKINEDLLMNFHLFRRANKSVFEDRCPYHYIVRATSASRQKLNEHKIYDPIRVKQIILAYCDANMKEAAVKALLTTCVYGYCTLVLEKKGYIKEQSDIRGVIEKYFSYVERLPKRTRVLAQCIVKIPRLFDILYPIYVVCLQKKKYN